MSVLSISSARSILVACSLYFALCGISATFFPVSWLWFSGLDTTISNELKLTFGVIGAYLTALAFGAYLASRDPVRNWAVTALLLAGNILDFLVTMRSVIDGLLPAINGCLFLGVTVVWSTLIALALRAR